MTWNFTENISEIYKKYWRKNQHQGAHTLSMREEGAPPASWAPWGSTNLNSNSIYSRSGRKNQREGFTFYDTEPPPSPNLSREGWSGVRSGLRRGESVAIVIINLPPSPISWCSSLCLSNSIVGLLDGDGLDEMYHVIELVLLGFDPWYPLCSEIDVAMTFPCLMLETLGAGAMILDLNRLCYNHYIHVLDLILQVIVITMCYYPATPEWQKSGPLPVMSIVWGVHVFTMC